MILLYHGLSVFTATLFLYYGAACLWSNAMIDEFERFGVPQFRVLTGVLEISGALGLAAGFLFPPLRVMAAAGLGILMTMVVIQRIQQRDSFVEMLQALVFAIITLWIAVYGAMDIVEW